MKREFTYELDEGIRRGFTRVGRMDEERVYI
jgi:hypothetical protein